MEQYLSLVRKVLKEGKLVDTRQGILAVATFAEEIEHDMQDGFPLVTTRDISFDCVASELEWYIRGRTDKKWLQERGNHHWDLWCNRKKVPYGTDTETRERMKAENDLGPIYGFQWRHFGAKYKGPYANYSGKGIDQLADNIKTMREDPNSRRMLVSAWNPRDTDMMAIPNCCTGFQLEVVKGNLNLIWTQRSVDVAVGLPYNLARHALLLHLLAKEAGFKEGKLTGHLGNVHIYQNNILGIEKQLERKPLALPKIRTRKFKSIFDWQYAQSHTISYKTHPEIKFPINV